MVRKKGAPSHSSNLSVSVVIPAYNAEKTLPLCLDALLQQTHLADEIIVVDDGSTDQTKTVADAYSLVTVVTQKNAGPAKARNVGAKKAHSKIILFLDSDCVPERDWLDNMLAPFDDSDVVGVQGAYQTNQKSNTAKFEQMDIEYRYERMKHASQLDWIGSYSAAYRKDVFVAEGGFNETFPRASGEDAELSYRLAEKGMKLVFNPKAVVYHSHPTQPWKYFETKFFRAFWRMRMYFLHPQKISKDSYTPTEVKLNTLFGFAFLFISVVMIATLILVNLTHFYPRLDLVLLFEAFLAMLVLIIIGFPKFLSFVAQKDVFFLPAAAFFLFIRSIAFSFGVIAGILDRRVRA